MFFLAIQFVYMFPEGVDEDFCIFFLFSWSSFGNEGQGTHRGRFFYPSQENIRVQWFRSLVYNRTTFKSSFSFLLFFFGIRITLGSNCPPKEGEVKRPSYVVFHPYFRRFFVLVFPEEHRGGGKKPEKRRKEEIHIESENQTSILTPQCVFFFQFAFFLILSFFTRASLKAISQFRQSLFLFLRPDLG